MDFLYVVDYDFEYDSGYCDCPEDDYHRCFAYGGLHVSKIDLDKVLRTIMGKTKFTITDAMREYARSLGLDDGDSYDINVERSYYGEEVSSITLTNPRHAARVRSWVHHNSVSVDLDGIATYLRNKGFDPTGYATVNEAVRASLLEENPRGVEPSYVRSTAQAHIARLPKNVVRVGVPKHYEAIEPVPVNRALSPVVTGVVVLVKSSGTYRLVDGYHRFKASATKTANYIVLS